jgi:hypothetical protein
MKESRSQKEYSFLSMEEQLKEASHDVTGKVRRYLELAEKLFHCDQNPHR